MHHTDWLDELGMFTVPKPLPSAEEREQIVGQRSARYPTLSGRLMASVHSVLRFVSPLPTAQVGSRLTDPGTGVKYLLVWLHTRLEFLGRLIGVDERWTMFSPSVGTTRTALRAVLTYDDGSEVSVRSLAEPADFTNFVRPFAQRRLQHDLDLLQLEDVRLNWCKYLARTQARNGSGSVLRSIALYEVRHTLAPPNVDATRHWRDQNALPLPPAPAFRFDSSSARLERTKDSQREGEDVTF